jgi:hypothetical protein
MMRWPCCFYDEENSHARESGRLGTRGFDEV